MRSGIIPELIRRPPLNDNLPTPDLAAPPISPRERRLYIALTLILGLNLLVICGAATFFALALLR